MRTKPRIAIAGALGFVLACSRAPEPIAVEGRIRLVDHLADAEFESAVDTTDPLRLVESTTRTLLDAKGAAVASLPWTRFHVDWNSLGRAPAKAPEQSARRIEPAVTARQRGASVEGPAVVLLPLPTVGDRDHEVSVAFHSAAIDLGSGTRDGIVVFELEGMPDAKDLAAASWVISLFQRTELAHRFDDRSGGRSTFRTAPETRALVLAVVSERGGIVESVAAARRTRLGGLLAHPIAIAGDPRAQRVLIGEERREALIFAAPGRVQFDLRIPSTATRLRAAIAPIDSLPIGPTAPRVEVWVSHAGADTKEQIALVSERWTEVALDLADHSGENVLVEFRCADSAGGMPLGIAIGTPVIDVAAKTRAPDVVLISLDTLRYDRTSSEDYPVPTTPRLTRLSEDSAVFRAAFAAAAYTLPSHATILSGRLPDAHGVTAPGSRYDITDDALLAVGFRTAGYATAGFTAGGYVRPEFGLARGFEIYRLDDPGRPEWREGDGPFRSIENESLRGLSKFLHDEHDAPVFLFVHTYAAHDYWAPKELFATLGPEHAIVADANDAAQVSVLRDSAKTEAVDLATQRRIRHLYDGAARLADETLARVLDILEADGRLENAILVVVSDHGEELFERGRIGHGFSVHDEMLHVPLIVHGPGVVAEHHDDVVSLADIAPTLRAWAGIAEPPGGVDGRSLLNLLRGGTTPSDPAYARILGDGDGAERALRGEHHKLRVIGDPYRPHKLVLHDLREDPSESTDRSLELPAIRSAMLQALQRRYREQIERPRTPLESSMSAETIRQLRELGYLDGPR